MNKRINIYVRTEFIIALFLGFLVIILYSPVVHFSFINYDDPEYVVFNPHVNQGLTLNGIKWAFTSFHASNWHPITWLSHMLDCQLFGLDAGLHHFTNLLLHLVNTLFLFTILLKFTKRTWPAACVAALFAVHPLHVESVAWIAERKDLLSTFFFLTVLWSYGRYAESSKKTFFYILTLLFFILGLMAKPMLVTLPFVLLLLDYWPLERFNKQNLNTGWFEKRVVLSVITEKIPFFLLSAISSYITVLAQKSAISAEAQYPFHLHIINSIIAYGRYIEKMIIPTHLAVLYPLPEHVPWLRFWVSLSFLLLVTLTCFYYSKKKPYLLMGWLWYVGTLVPVIGIVQVGVQSMADRYTYIPLIGIFIMLSWMGSDLINKWMKLKYPGVLCFGILIVLLSITTRFQLGYWKNSISLFRHTLQVTKNNYIAENNFGLALVDKGNPQEASKHFALAIQINPVFSTPYLNLGLIQESKHAYQKAMDYYHKALTIKPSFAEVYFNIGNIYFHERKYKKAQEKYLKVLQLKPDFAEAYNGLGAIFTRTKDFDKAITAFQKALALGPYDIATKQNLVNVYCSLGNHYLRQGRYKDASANYLAAIKIQPDSSQAYNGLGAFFTRIGNFDKALFCFKKALAISPQNATARQNLKELLKSKRE